MTDQPITINIQWRNLLTDREQAELRLSETYARDYGHGTAGHLHLMLVAKLAFLLDKAARQIELPRKDKECPSKES